MRSSVKVDQANSIDFFLKYDTLGPLQKKIFKCIQWYCLSFSISFPRQEIISKKVGCSRKHVNKTFSLFKKWGWIRVESRGFRSSKRVVMPLKILEMQVTKNHRFMRQEVTSEVTHSYLNKERKNTSIPPTPLKVRFRKPKTGVSIKEFTEKIPPPPQQPNNILKIPRYLQETQLSFEEKLKLSLVTEGNYRGALELTQYKYKNGFKIHNVKNYVIGAALKMEEKSRKLNWCAYYNTLNFEKAKMHYQESLRRVC